MSAYSRPGSVTVTPCDSKGTWLIALQGEHDLSTAELLHEQTSGIWRFCKAAVIDLSETDFIDSTVIRWLLSAERELEAAGAFTFSIVEGPPGSAAARVFRALHVHHVLACYPTRQDAFAQASDTHASRARAIPSGIGAHSA